MDKLIPLISDNFQRKVPFTFGVLLIQLIFLLKTDYFNVEYWGLY